MQQLRLGYTTGTHATATLLACLKEFYEQKITHSLEVILPQNKSALIEVHHKAPFEFFSIKGDNDDIDVTKGAKIFCKLTQTPPQNLKQQTPTLLFINQTKLFIWAGDGVGIVTKKGLKITPNHPAINPIPLQMMQQNAISIIKYHKDILHIIFSVENGEMIAHDTANAKVGVLGGISILGTRGIVKPVSASAYIDSIATEIDVASAYNPNVIVFTLGNSAIDFAKTLYDETSIVEIGNFVYDASAKLKKHHFNQVVFITSVAKMTKVAQGFKNTHNKFGTIDFHKVKECIKNNFHYELKDEEFVTLKGVMEHLDTKYHEDFIQLITQKAVFQMQQWFDELQLPTKKLTLITLPKKIKKELQW